MKAATDPAFPSNPGKRGYWGWRRPPSGAGGARKESQMLSALLVIPALLLRENAPGPIPRQRSLLVPVPRGRVAGPGSWSCRDRRGESQPLGAAGPGESHEQRGLAGRPGLSRRRVRGARGAADPPARRGSLAGAAARSRWVRRGLGPRERRARGRRGRRPPRCGRRPPCCAPAAPWAWGRCPGSSAHLPRSRPSPGVPGQPPTLEQRAPGRRRRRRRRRRRPLQPAGARSAGGGGARGGVAAGGCARRAGAPERPASPPAPSLSLAPPQTHTHQAPTAFRPRRPPPLRRGQPERAVTPRPARLACPAPSAQRAQPRSIFPLPSQPSVVWAAAAAAAGGWGPAWGRG